MATKKRLHQTFDEVQEILDSVDSKTNVQSDWFQNDQSKDDYVKNRTHWRSVVEEIIADLTLNWEKITPATGEPYYDFFVNVRGTVFHSSHSHAVWFNDWQYQIDCTSSDTLRRFWYITIHVSDQTGLMTSLSVTSQEDLYHPASLEIYPNDLGESYSGYQLYRTTPPEEGSAIEFIHAGTRYYPKLPYEYYYYSKLDNRYLDTDSQPAEGSDKPITSSGVYDALADKAKIKSGTTAYWDASSYRPVANEIIIYTDKSTKIVDGQTVNVPGIKIGSGNTYVQDLAFVSDDVAASLITHVNDNVRHVTQSERESWNGKEDISNKVSSISSSSTDTQYPSAKAAYDAMEGRMPYVFTGTDMGMGTDATLVSGDFDEAMAALGEGRQVILALTDNTGRERRYPLFASGGNKALNFQLDITGHRLSYTINHYNQLVNDSTRDYYERTDRKVTSMSAQSTDTQYPSAKAVYDALSVKQDTLESGVNVKTVNGESILGPGDVEFPMSDWSQNDQSKDDYVKNRTHWAVDLSVGALFIGWYDEHREIGLYYQTFYALKPGHDFRRDTNPSHSGIGGVWSKQVGINGDDNVTLKIESNSDGSLTISANDSVIATVESFFDPTSGQIIYQNSVIWLGFAYNTVIPEEVHKLDNKYLDLDSAPTTGSGKPVTSGGVYTAISGFITKSVNDLVNYYTKSETYTQTEVNNLIGAIQSFHYEIATSTSAVTDPQGNVLYLIGPTGSGADKYEEYVYSNNAWVKIGDTSVDLSGYVTTSALNTALAGYVTSADFQSLALSKGSGDMVLGEDTTFTPVITPSTDTVPNVTSVGAADTWSFTLVGSTLKIGGGNGTAPTLGTAKSVVTGIQSASITVGTNDKVKVAKYDDLALQKP